jgi:hypothetical protein
VRDQLLRRFYSGLEAEKAQRSYLQIWLHATAVQYHPVYGKRIPDYVYNDPYYNPGNQSVLDEVKAGTGGKLNSRTRGQVANDVALRNSGVVDHLVWDFYLGKTGYQGPSAGLESLLNANDIDIRIHTSTDEDEPQPSVQRQLLPPSSSSPGLPVIGWLPRAIPAPILVGG